MSPLRAAHDDNADDNVTINTDSPHKKHKMKHKDQHVGALEFVSVPKLTMNHGVFLVPKLKKLAMKMKYPLHMPKITMSKPVPKINTSGSKSMLHSNSKAKMHSNSNSKAMLHSNSKARIHSSSKAKITKQCDSDDS